jgi:hypothetical protein
MGERIQEMVEGVREMVDRAIDWLIDRAIAGGQALINMLRRGVAAVRNWWSEPKPFTTTEGEPHALYFEGTGSGARLMIRSEPQTYRTFLANVLVEGTAKQTAKAEAVEIAGQLDQAIARAGSGAAPGAGPAAAPAAAAGAAPPDPSAEINDLLDRLAAATARFMPSGGASTEPEFGPLTHTFGTSVAVARIVEPCTGGSDPGVGGSQWNALLKRYDGGMSYYVRGHLMNNTLGGTGDDWKNLTPLTNRANLLASGSMYRRFERAVQDAVIRDHKTVNLLVTAAYNRSHPLASKLQDLRDHENEEFHKIAEIVEVEQHVPETVECVSYELTDGQPAGSPIARHTVQNEVATNLNLETGEGDYELTPAGRVPRIPKYLNEMSPTQLEELDSVGPQVAQKIISRKPSGGYRRRSELSGTGINWDRAAETSGVRLFLYRRT